MARERLVAFSVLALIVYTLAYYFDWPLVRYYPTSDAFTFSEQSRPPFRVYPQKKLGSDENRMICTEAGQFEISADRFRS
jgi:hypothetical protein